ncbi:histidine kinase [Galbibacter sp. EGI 63066]|uniref:histidine kinase n=1 Tax=Galbibacter sp. EGI 63066 TaxID=2993559 RepID=UPI002249878E|nr:sensor histidine kinase [Galbibacter sp. EGI 63066]MCX2681843.1 histidine kinase [Galbibacter sp. EGI 63066]
MNLRSLYNFFLICLIFSVTSCSQKPVFKEYKTLFQIGDQQEWATKNWNDKNWKERIKLVPDGQIFWSRTKVDILKTPDPLKLYGLRLEVYGEYEVYWDGVLIGKNGNPGQEAMLPPEGKLWATFSIPTHLTEEGEHLLAIRSSLYYFPDHTGIWSLDVDYYDDLLTDRLIETSYMHIFAGAFLIISFYFLFLFLNNKNEYPTLIFSVCCFLVFALVLTVFSKDYLPIHYSLHVIRLQIISSLLLGISFLIPFYFSMQFPYSRRGLLLILYAGVLIFIFLVKHHAFDFKAVSMVLSMWCFSFGVVSYGAYKNVRGARLVLVTLLLSMVIFLASGFVISLYTGLGLILLGMLYLLSLNIKAQRLAYENSLVQSTRLRLELLKKNIQPHFLMNTLTSLIDWIEETPKKGVLFIEALAREFDLFNQIENKTLIPIAQEIALCRTHLEIMEYRKEINYSWQEEGIDIEQKIPPGILHTLLENGITHSLPLEDNSIKFKLIFESNSNYKCYTFLTFATRGRQATTNREDGTGLKYVKARLTESYHEQWDFTSEPVNHGWKNTIKIYS